MVGFTEGEGRFRVDITKSDRKLGKTVRLSFQITQNESDKELLTLIILYLKCGTLKSHGIGKTITVTRFEDIHNIIIPFFQKYPLQGTKNLDFTAFIEIAELIKSKIHLTSEGLNKILLIKSDMPIYLKSPLSDLDKAEMTKDGLAINNITYTNMETQKNQILAENRNKSGVYRLKNIISGKTYIGSSQNLSKRFILYFSLKTLKAGTGKNTPINKALLKYGYSNFSLEILEYCDPQISIEREQYYLDLCIGEYNILTVAGSNKGFKFSAEARLNMSGRRHTEESKDLMREARKGKNHPMFGKTGTNQNKNKYSERFSYKSYRFRSKS